MPAFFSNRSEAAHASQIQMVGFLLPFARGQPMTHDLFGSSVSRLTSLSIS